MLRTLLLSTLPFLSSAALPAPPTAPAPRMEVFLTTAEALELAYPECVIEKETIWMTKEQRKQIEALLEEKLPSGIARPYVARRKPKKGQTEGELVGYAWFDTHRVRTHKEVVMFATDPEGVIQRIELLAFGEPNDYIGPDKWYALFVGQGLTDELRVGRAIRPITGASLTVHATTNAARRCLASQQVLLPPPAPEPAAPAAR
ncbi:MAG: FMN-binding protein [Planctomycetota bacterium]